MKEALGFTIIAILAAWVIAWIRAYRDTDNK